MRTGRIVGMLVVCMFSIHINANNANSESSAIEVVSHQERTYACIYRHSVGMKEVNGRWESVNWKIGEPFFLRWFHYAYEGTDNEYYDTTTIVADEMTFTDCKTEDVLTSHCKSDGERIEFFYPYEKGVLYSVSKLVTNVNTPVHITNFDCTEMGFRDFTQE